MLKKIKKMKMAQLGELTEKLEIIQKTKMKNLGKLNYSCNFKDLSEALIFCIYHFKGGLKESIADECPCRCLCESCEVIPENPIGVRMQEIATHMKEKNVILDFFDEYKDYVKSIDSMAGNP